MEEVRLTLLYFAAFINITHTHSRTQHLHILTAFLLVFLSSSLSSFLLSSSGDSVHFDGRE